MSRTPVARIGYTVTVTSTEIQAPTAAAFSSRGPNKRTPEIIKVSAAIWEQKLTIELPLINVAKNFQGSCRERDFLFTQMCVLGYSQISQPQEWA